MRHRQRGRDSALVAGVGGGGVTEPPPVHPKSGTGGSGGGPSQESPLLLVQGKRIHGGRILVIPPGARPGCRGTPPCLVPSS